MVLRQPLILVVAAVLLLEVGQQLLVQQAAQALSSFPTLAHNEAQAAQSHQAVATLFTHLQQAVHLRHDYARAPERAF
jgi:hypothetical protein